MNVHPRELAAHASPFPGEARLPHVGEFPPPRRIPAEDIVAIGRAPAPKADDGAAAEVVRVVPRISRRRLAFRAVLVLALIGEIAVASRVWPRTPVAVPDASGPRSMIA